MIASSLGYEKSEYTNDLNQILMCKYQCQLKGYVKGTLFSSPNVRDPDTIAAMGDSNGPYDRSWYAAAYFDAGFRLAETCRNDPGLNDTLVFPMVFCFRHGCELAIKDLLDRLAELRDGQLVGHLLLKERWERLKPRLQMLHTERSWTLVETDTLAGVERLLTDIDALDAGSFSFRYPKDTKGNPMLNGLEEFDVQVISQWLTALGKWFKDLMLCIREIKPGDA